MSDSKQRSEEFNAEVFMKSASQQKRNIDEYLSSLKLDGEEEKIPAKK
jgi:hypothetical protein